MNRLDNMRSKTARLTRKCRNAGLLALALTLPMGLGSCQKDIPANENRVATRPSAEAIAEADQLYAGRADLTKVRQGLVALRQAQADDPSNYELAWRLAKFNYHVGSHSPDSDEQEKSFHDGIEAGKLATRLQDGKPDGHFWLGANYGGKAQISTLSGYSAIDDIKHEMEAVLKIDEGYQAGSAYMVLGQVYLEAPRMFGGDAQKALEYLEKGLRFGPDNSLLRLHLATAYSELDRKEEARKQIDYLLAMKPSPGYGPEHEEAVAKAKKLQEKLK